MPRSARIAISMLIAAAVTLNHPVAAQSPDRIIIALDVSGSMRGAPLSAAISAANRLLLDVESDTQLDIYIFNREYRLLDSARSGELLETSQLNALSGGGYTSLYDVTSDLAELAGEQSAPLIIITDGNDSRSNLSSFELVSQLRGWPIPIYFIAYQPKESDLALLNELSALTTGGVYNIDSVGQLAATFKSAIEVVSDTSTDAPSHLPALFASATGALALVALNSLRLWRRREDRLDSWGGLIDRYKFTPLHQESKPATNTTPHRLIRNLIGNTALIAPRITTPALRESLAVGPVLTCFAILTLIGLPLVPAAIGALLISLITLRALVSQATRSIQREFEADLPGSLKMIAASLSAGLSFLQALDSFSQESSTGVGKEFRRALYEIQMGATVERALGDVANRMASDDLRWVMYAFSVQREVGGSLAKILQTSAETIESRANLRQEIRTLSAEGRISSYILMALPPTIFFFLLLTRPSFIAIFWEEAIGHAMLAVIALLMFFAWLWIRRLIRQEA